MSRFFTSLRSLIVSGRKDADPHTYEIHLSLEFRIDLAPSIDDPEATPLPPDFSLEPQVSVAERDFSMEFTALVETNRDGLRIPVSSRAE